MRFLALAGLTACLLPCSLVLAQPKDDPAKPVLNDALRRDIEAAREKVYPALVNIAVVSRYFNEGRAHRAPSAGSGVIVDAKGHVLTNFHVAGNSTRIACTLPGGEAIDADVIAHDPLTDLSVLRLRLDRRRDPNAPLPHAPLGDSDTLRVGDYVMAVGNPLTLSSSMTLGIVSNTRRVFTDFTGTDIEQQDLADGELTGLFTRWVQHDALILPGNSGGPLVNLKGEVVGINELGGNGMGFAIPSNIARDVLRQALEHGGVRRGWLGVSVLPVGKMGREKGALVSAVWPGSPAEKAGLQPGDILTSLNGTPVNARFFEEVPLVYQAVAALPVGKPAALAFERGGGAKTATADVALMAKYRGEEAESRDMGATVQEITAPMALFRELATKDGVLVTGVRAGFAFEAAQPPIVSGDVIQAIGETPTPTLDAFRSALTGADKGQFLVKLLRDREQIVSVVKAITDKTPEADTDLPKPWLGVKTQVLTTDIAASLGLAGAKGFRVTEVLPLTPASKAGFRPGDILTSVNGRKLTAFRPQDSEDLKRVLEELSVGEDAAFGLVREGKPLTLSVKMEATPSGPETAKRSRQREFEFAVRDILPLDRIQNRWKADQKGVIVTEATPGGWAAVAGLQTDDLLISVNGEASTDVAAFERLLKDVLAKKPRVVSLFVRRGYRTHFVFLEPEWQKVGELK